MALGDTWETVSLPISEPINSLKVLSSGRIVGVGPNRAAVYSDDGGATWTKAGEDGNPTGQFIGIAQSPSGRLFTADDSYSYPSYSDDNGENWQITPDSAAIVMRELVVTPTGRLIIVGGYFFGGPPDMVYSDDDGATFSAMFDNGVENSFVDIQVLDNGVLLVLTDDASPEGAYLSEDDGDTWGAVPFFAANDWRSAVHYASPAYTLVSTITYGGSNIVASDDNGISWEDLTLPSLVSGQNDRGPLNILPQGALLLAANAAQAESRIFMSVDRGASWSQVYTQSTSTGSSIVVNDLSPQFAVQLETGEVFIATDTPGVLLKTQGEAAAPPDPPPPWWTAKEGVTEIRRA